MIEQTVVSTSVSATTILVISIMGTFVFALSGALAAIRARLDLFGVGVLALTVGLAGGTLRDILLNDRPIALFDWRVVVAALAAACIALILRTPLDRWQHSIDAFDAIGLGLFSVLGTDIALQHNVGPLPAVLLGCVTATGGGVVRDVLLRKVPEVLRQGLYAVPALLGSTVIVIAFEIDRTSLWWYAFGAGLCIAVRLAGMHWNINLPIAPLPEGESESKD